MMHIKFMLFPEIICNSTSTKTKKIKHTHITGEYSFLKIHRRYYHTYGKNTFPVILLTVRRISKQNRKHRTGVAKQSVRPVDTKENK